MKSKHLGKDTLYQLETYSPSFLDAVKRNSPKEAAIYFGHDYWNAYEFSYLNSKRQPVLESLEIKIPMTSIYTVESKSLKLYLASFFNKKFNDPKKAYAWRGEGRRRVGRCRVACGVWAGGEWGDGD